MKVLIVGGGGREHALAWRFKKDNPALTLYAAPGNPGIAELATCLPISITEFDALATFARREGVSLTVVGPEAPLAAGIVDHFRAERLPIFGPTRDAAQIETSKSFAKQLMLDARVPTARALTFTDADRARGAARELGAPVVIKASGLAAGKGVMVCETLADADRAIDAVLVQRTFGVAGSELLVEDQAAFLPLPKQSFEARYVDEGTANSESLVRFDTNDYSVPARYAHRKLLVAGV